MPIQNRASFDPAFTRGLPLLLWCHARRRCLLLLGDDLVPFLGRHISDLGLGKNTVKRLGFTDGQSHLVQAAILLEFSTNLIRASAA